MSRKYKFHNKEALYFVSFATVYWVDVFVRSIYNDIFVESLKYAKANFGLELYCWRIMPSHIHLMCRAKHHNPELVLGRIKTFSSKHLVQAIHENRTESRRDWLLKMFKQAACNSSNVKRFQFWQHDNRPIELWSAKVIDQKADYIHANPVMSGFVNEAWHWKYSSAIDYSGGKGLIDLDYL